MRGSEVRLLSPAPINQYVARLGLFGPSPVSATSLLFALLPARWRYSGPSGEGPGIGRQVAARYGSATVGDDAFDSQQAALNEVLKTIDEAGMDSLPRAIPSFDYGW